MSAAQDPADFAPALTCSSAEEVAAKVAKVAVAEEVVAEAQLLRPASADRRTPNPGRAWWRPSHGVSLLEQTDGRLFRFFVESFVRCYILINGLASNIQKLIAEPLALSA